MAYTNYYKKQNNSAETGDKPDYSKFTMVQVLGTSTITSYAEKMNLTQEQRQRATSSALELSNNEALAKCDQFSLAKFCLESARYNFVRNDFLYAVPYKGKVQAQMGYKGYRELAMRAGYREVNCSEVLSCDRIVRDRATGKVNVIFEEDYTKTEKSAVVGYFAYAIDEDGTLVNTKYWTKEKCIKHGQHYSKSYDSIWGDENNFTKMAMKTVIKQLCQELRSTPELAMALKQDQIVYGGRNEEDKYLDNPNADRNPNDCQVKNTLQPKEPETVDVKDIPVDNPLEDKKD